MKNRFWIGAVLCLLSSASGRSQSSPGALPGVSGSPSQAAAAPQASDEDKVERAYTAASRILDPAAKIKALEDFKKSFRDAEYSESADMLILGTLAGRVSGADEAARKQANLIYKSAPKGERGRIATSIAEKLLSSHGLLPDALKYARMGLDAANEKKYIKQQTAAARKQEDAAPSSEALAKRFAEMRASRLAMVGRAESALGNDAAGAKLLREAHQALPNNTNITGALGEVLARQGDDAAAMDLLVQARLAGRVTASTVSALDALYRKTHAGSGVTLDEFLNTEYRKRYPEPIKVEPYKPTGGRTSRVVLAEVFTGAGCPPCAGADLAFDAARERYTPKELAVLMYHQHVPRPDPMTNPDSRNRAKYYAVAGVPTFAIDGKTAMGGGGRSNAQGIFDGEKGIKQAIEAELESPAEADVKASASIGRGAVVVNASVAKQGSQSGDIVVHIVLAEKQLTYSGENGIRFHPMVVRSMGSAGAEGYKAGGAQADFRETFNLAEVSAALKAHLDEYESQGHRGEPFKFVQKMVEINPENLAVVVFAQDAASKRVLQSVYIDLAPIKEGPGTE
jgi:hypothetical protein